MCGRYVLTAPISQLYEIYGATPDGDCDFNSSYNVFPTRPEPIILQQNKDRIIRSHRWGLVPEWSDGPTPKYWMINARSETLAEKPAFRDAYKKRRCVVPVNGFYEWKQTPDGKQPFYIYLDEGNLISLAGLYEHWGSGADKIDSFTIITTSPNKEMQGIHDRMPAILMDYELDYWLDPDNQDTKSLQELLRPYPDDQIQYHPVSKEVNSPRNQGEELIEPVTL